MKVLVLTGKFGMGHVAAANAVAERLRTRYRGAQVDVVDLMEYMYPQFYKYIYIGYNALVMKTPKIYNSMICLDYQLSRLPFKGKSANAYIIRRLIGKYDPDVIVSTWFIASKYIEAYKKRTGDNIPVITCVTDIVAFNDWISDSTDAYLGGSEETRKSLVDRGVDPDDVYVGGIPVRPVFGDMRHAAAEECREVLVMGGGLGFIPQVYEVLDTLCGIKTLHTTVITGTNKRLYEELSEKYSDDDSSVSVIGCTGNVEKYMEAADIIVTKPGGVTMSESIQAELPMFVLNPYFEQERTNAIFIEEKGLGRVVWGHRQSCGGELAEFISDVCGRQKIKKNMHAVRESMRGNEIDGILDEVIEKTCRNDYAWRNEIG